MKLRVKYAKRLGLWFGQVKYKDDGVWFRETRYCWTKYGAKRELRKWYKQEVAPQKIEEMEPGDLSGGRLIDILKPLLIGMAVACFAVFICARYMQISEVIIFMENLKLGLRIASIVVGLIVYCYIWKYILDDFYDSFDDSILYQTVLTIWIVLHVIGIVTAVVWAWC